MATPPEDLRIEAVDDDMAAVLRSKTPGQRMAIALGAWGFAQEWIRAGVRSQHADWPPAEVDREVCRRLLGDTV